MSSAIRRKSLPSVWRSLLVPKYIVDNHFTLFQQSALAADDSGSNIGETPATVRTVRPAKAPKELTPEQQAEADAIDLRCLSLCIGMLERVNGVSQSRQTYGNEGR